MLISQKCHEMYYLGIQLESMTSRVLLRADFRLITYPLLKARRVVLCYIPDQISLTTHN